MEADANRDEQVYLQGRQLETWISYLDPTFSSSCANFFSHLKCHCNHGMENIQTLTNRLNVIHEQNLSRRNSFTKNFFWSIFVIFFKSWKIKDEINKAFLISMTIKWWVIALLTPLHYMYIGKNKCALFWTIPQEQ